MNSYIIFLFIYVEKFTFLLAEALNFLKIYEYISSFILRKLGGFEWVLGSIRVRLENIVKFPPENNYNKC